MNVWDEKIESFSHFLTLEKSLSANSVEAYIRDVKKLQECMVEMSDHTILPQEVSIHDLREFIYWLHQMGIGFRSQARIISGIKAFFNFLWIEKHITDDPTELLESPKINATYPTVLSIEEIDRMLYSIDTSKKEAQRNKAIIETLYSCGLRVSELIDLKISNLYISEGFVKVTGKGNKERLIPINEKAIREITYYFESTRNHQTPKPNCSDFVFLNRNGGQLTRVMIFTIVKQLTQAAGIDKNVSPHTFRHSFATHLVDGGANLRAIQSMLGHESITTTEIYTHIGIEHLHNTLLLHHPRAMKH